MTSLRVAGAVLVAALFLAWLIAQGSAPLAAMAAALLHPLLPLALAGLLLSHLLRALRLYEELRAETGWRYRDALAVSLQHVAWVSLLPLRAGEAALPLLLRRRLGIELSRGAATLAWMRWQDAVVLATVLLLVVPGLAWSLRLVGVAVLLLAAAALPRLLSRWRSRSAMGGERGVLASLLSGLDSSARSARRGWLWTGASWAVKLLAQALVFALVLPVTLSAGVLGVLGGEAAALSPLQGLAGFGSQELGAALALSAYGVPIELGLKAAFVLHLLGLTLTLALALIAWVGLAPKTVAQRVSEGPSRAAAIASVVPVSAPAKD